MQLVSIKVKKMGLGYSSMYLHTTLALCSLFVVLIGSQVAAGVTPLDSTRWLSSPILIDDKAPGANMIVHGDNVYFTWPSPAIMFSGSTDGGNTFSRPISIAFDPLNGYLSINPAPQIAAINVASMWFTLPARTSI